MESGHFLPANTSNGGFFLSSAAAKRRTVSAQCCIADPKIECLKKTIRDCQKTISRLKIANRAKAEKKHELLCKLREKIPARSVQLQVDLAPKIIQPPKQHLTIEQLEEFLHEQEHLRKRCSHSYQYGEVTKNFAYAFYTKSPAAYRFIRLSGAIILPDETTLRAAEKKLSSPVEPKLEPPTEN